MLKMPTAITLFNLPVSIFTISTPPLVYIAGLYAEPDAPCTGDDDGLFMTSSSKAVFGFAAGGGIRVELGIASVTLISWAALVWTSFTTVAVRKDFLAAGGAVGFLAGIHNRKLYSKYV